VPVKTATWKWALSSLPSASLPQQIVTFLAKPQEARYTRRRNGYCEVSATFVQSDDLIALEGAAYKYALMGYRNGILRFNGQIIEHRDSKDQIDVVAKDPYYNLAWRRIQKDMGMNYEAGEVAARLIEQQNSYVRAGLYPTSRTTFLRRGTIEDAPLTAQKREYEVGATVSDQIEYLSKVPDSFVFVIGAVDGETDYMARFNAYVETADVVATQAQFQFGQDTLENISDYQRSTIPLVTKANIVGDLNKVASAESISGTTTYGRWEDERGQVLTKDDDTLLDIANEFVMDDPIYAISISPTAEAPQLFTDFDVHQKVPVVIERRGATIVGDKRVMSVTISLDPDSGAETMDEIVIVDTPDEEEA
jgi:hypothetical protein